VIVTNAGQGKYTARVEKSASRPGGESSSTPDGPLMGGRRKHRTHRKHNHARKSHTHVHKRTHHKNSHKRTHHKRR
jgi:hypothetical protein